MHRHVNAATDARGELVLLHVWRQQPTAMHNGSGMGGIKPSQLKCSRRKSSALFQQCTPARRVTSWSRAPRRVTSWSTNHVSAASGQRAACHTRRDQCPKPQTWPPRSAPRLSRPGTPHRKHKWGPSKCQEGRPPPCAWTSRRSAKKRARPSVVACCCCETPIHTNNHPHTPSIPQGFPPP